MKNFELVHTERRSIMEKISNGLKQIKDGAHKKIEDTDGYTEPMTCIPVLVVNLPFEYQNDENRCGFSVMVSQETFKPVGASWYRATGVSTYRESKLTDEELEELERYYSKHLKGLWHKFCKCVID